MLTPSGMSFMSIPCSSIHFQASINVVNTFCNFMSHLD